MSNNKILILGLLITAGVAAFLFWPGNESPSDLFKSGTEVVM
jgi:hypothetical protein